MTPLLSSVWPLAATVSPPADCRVPSLSKAPLRVSVPLPPLTVDTMKAASLPLLVKLVAVTVAPVVACTVPRLVSEPPWDVSVEPARMTLLALLLFRLNR